MTRSEFSQILRELRDCYNQPFDAGQFAGQVSAYWKRMERFNDDDIRYAAKESAARFPRWMPSVGDLVQLCNENATSRRHEWEERKRLESEARENNAIREMWAKIPTTQEQAIAWIKSSRTCSELAARVWATSDKASGRNGTQPTEEKTAAIRFPIIMQIIETNHKTSCDICTALETGTQTPEQWSGWIGRMLGLTKQSQMPSPEPVF